jgi:aldehyde dehydrogenase (NAD+)
MVNAQDYAMTAHDRQPLQVSNWINGEQTQPRSGLFAEKYDPASGAVMCEFARSDTADVEAAVAAALRAYPEWSATSAVTRGDVLARLAHALQTHRSEVAAIVAQETGKGMAAALGETDGAIALGHFMAGEGRRMYGRTTTSASPHKWAMTVREPLGVAGLIIAANTPIANVAWKVFPALICGNAAILKAAEYAPLTAWIFGRIASECGLPPGTLNIIQGLGTEAGAALVAHPQVSVVSFTGSTGVGRQIAEICGRRLARVSLELGGKNPFVVADDADIPNAVRWALLSAFSNAGQRCASGSRIIVFDAVYHEFRAQLVQGAEQMRVGATDADDFGPVISERQLNSMLAALERAKAEGARVLTGGHRYTDAARAKGYYIAPTIVEDVAPGSVFDCTELFGPITSLHRVTDFENALQVANNSPYGLTACIHTRDVNRALTFARAVQAGVAVVNGGTFGSEPHMPFGGVKDSGNGSREPGTEALDVYSNLKSVALNFDPNAC